MGKQFIILCVFSLCLFGCKLGTQTYGGSQPATTVSLETAASIVSSTACVMSTAPSQVTTSSGDITNIANRKTSFASFSAPFDLAPDTPILGTLSGGWISINPSSSSVNFATGFSKTISSSSLAFAALIKNTSRGEVISVNNFDRDSQAFALNVDSTNIKALFKSSTSDYYQVSEANPTASSVIVVGNFSSDDGTIELSVQGSYQATAVATGSPTAPFNLPRMIGLGPWAAGENLEIKDFYVFNRSLTKPEMGSMILLIAQDNSISNITLDEIYNSSTSDSSDPNFAAAQAVIQSKCLNCHATWSGVQAKYYFNNGLATKGDANSSKIYYRLSASTGTNGPKNMPVPGSISAAEADLIKYWINNAP